MRTKAIDSAELRLELTRVLQSRAFERAKRSQQFLRYLVEAALADPPAAVKEYVIAVEVFDRASTYDPSVDATVRVEASRLRSRLREYYAEQGRNNPWRIEFPNGSYSVVLAPHAPEAREHAKTWCRNWCTRIALAATVLATVFALFLALRQTWEHNNASLGVQSIETLTTDPGLARGPAISPNGTQLAYSWDGEDGVSHIYLKAFAEQQSFNLTHSKNPDRYPVWSPDGKEIVFARFTSPDDADIVKISAHGGKETVIRPVKWGVTISRSEHMFAWTASHKWLCFPDQTPSGLFQLFLLSLENGSVKPLHAAPSNWDESSPAFSPDGHWVAFARIYGMVNTQIMIQKLNHSEEPTGKPIAVSDGTGNPSSPVWLEDGRLVFLRGGSLVQVSASHPAEHQFYTANSDLRGLTYDSRHARLITSQFLADSDIWSLPLKGIAAAGAPKRLVQSTAEEDYPAFSPDGQWLAFVSTRGGTSELWLADAEGHNPRQLTRLSAYLVGFPHWSSDSKFIVFHARMPKTPEIYLLRLENNSLRKLTDGAPGFVAPSFSIDGRNVYCMQFHAGVNLLFRIGVDGNTQEPLWSGSNPIEVPGRNTLLYLKDGEAGIYERSLSGKVTANPEARLVRDFVPIQSLCVISGGIFYSTTSRPTSRGEIRYYSFATRQSTAIASADAGSTVSLRPDGVSLAYDGPAETNSQLLEMKIQ